MLKENILKLLPQSTTNPKLKKHFNQRLQQVKKQRALEEHQYLTFGIGITGYFLLIEHLIGFLLVMSLISVCQISIFKADNPAYLVDKTNTFYRVLASTTLGSYSQIKPLCWKVPIQMNKLQLNCHERHIQSIFDFGII